jgi:hypothetical protein
MVARSMVTVFDPGAGCRLSSHDDHVGALVAAFEGPG